MTPSCREEPICSGCRSFKLFFEVATNALGFDPSCEPGQLDPMCVAEAIRGQKQKLAEQQAKIGRLEKENQEIIGEIRFNDQRCIDLFSEERASLCSRIAMLEKEVKGLRSHHIPP